MLRALGVIPARYASTRFPGKPLAPLGNGTLLSAVWSAASRARRLDRVVVATEDDRVVVACRGFGAAAVMTSARHASGTDRVAEAVRGVEPAPDVVVNVQGDEPFVTPSALDRLVDAFEKDPDLAMATLSEPVADVEQLFDPGTVKVVARSDGTALYFSRAPIPFHRGGDTALSPDFRAALGSRPGGLSGYRKHQGIYAYRRATLLALAAMPPSPLELDEGLEQLRALQAGIGVLVVDSDFVSISVDTPADLARAERHLSRQEIAR